MGYNGAFYLLTGSTTVAVDVLLQLRHLFLIGPVGGIALGGNGRILPVAAIGSCIGVRILVLVDRAIVEAQLARVGSIRSPMEWSALK